MTSANCKFREEKACNFAKWIDRTLQRYNAPEGKYLDAVKEFTDSVITDQAKRSYLSSAMFCAVLLDSAPFIAPLLKECREFYLCSEEERQAKADELIASLESLHNRMAEALAVVKERREELVGDLRMLGGYTEIFFGQMLK